MGEADGISLVTRGGESSLWVPGTISAERSAAIEEAVWDRMHFASHLRTERLGEFTVGTALHRSEALAITQLLVLYQLVTARAAIALGAEQPAPTGGRSPTSLRHHEACEQLHRGPDRADRGAEHEPRPRLRSAVETELAQPPGLELGLHRRSREQRNP